MRDAASRFGAALAFALLGAALFAGSASAAFLHSGSSTGHFGSDGTEGTQFGFLQRGTLAVNQSTQKLYAVEGYVENPATERRDIRIYAFDLNNSHTPLGGNFPIEIPEGQYSELARVLAVDNSGTASSGNFYYLEKNNSYETRPSVLWGFNAAGEPLGGEFPVELTPPIDGCGVNVDAEGHIWVGDLTSGSLKEYTATGIPLTRSIKLEHKQGNACYFAFNQANDDVYVDGREINDGNLFRYTAASNYKNATEIEPGNAPYQTQIAFDSTHQVLYIGGRAFNPDGVPLESGSYYGEGLALDESTGTLYTGEGINIFPSTGEIPDVTTEGASGTMVEATVDPLGGGEVTGCAFEYGTTTSYAGGEVACEQATPFSGVKSVTADLGVLTPEVLYHYRAKATNAAGTYIGVDRTFIPHRVQDLHTGPATPVGKSTATLTASYTGTGLDTHYYFEWGPTTEYGNKTTGPPGADDGIVSGPEPLSAAISGLTADSTYHYRVIASNSEGTSIGEDRTFETAHAVTGMSTSIDNLTGSSVTLEGDWTGDNTDTHYYFEWGATTVYGHKTAVPPGEDAGASASPQHGEADVTELQPLSRYHFRLIATNTSGTTVTPDATFRTPQLAAVSYSPVLKITPTSAELVGSVNPRNTGPTTYHFEYGLDPTYGQNTPESGSVGSDESVHPATAVIEGLSPGTTYHYRLVATSPTGAARGPDQKFITIPNLPTVTSSSSSNLVIGGATFNAGVRPGFGPTVVYFVYGPTTGYGKATIPVGPFPGDDIEHDVSIPVSSLIANTVYHFRVVAVNFAGVSYGPDETFETPGLPEVGTALASNVSRTGATLDGQVNPRHTATTYSFEYGTTPAYGSRVAGSGSVGSDAVFHQVSASLGNLAPGTTYHFRLVATNALGSAAGPDHSFTTATESVIHTTPPPPVNCRKGQVKRHGKCVKKPRRHHRRHHSRRTG